MDDENNPVIPGLYYIVNRWGASGGHKQAGKMLGLSTPGILGGGEKVSIGAQWGMPSGDKVLWELVRAPEPRCYYLINRWRGADGKDNRCGRLLGFRGGKYAVLEPLDKGDQVPWELVPATKWNPTTGRPEQWCPSQGGQGIPGCDDPASAAAGGTPYYIVNRFPKCNGHMLDFSKGAVV